MPNSIELRQSLKLLKDEMTSLNTAAEKENRGFNSDEDAKWDKMTDDAITLNKRIARAEKIEKIEKQNLETSEDLKDIEDRNDHSIKNNDRPTYEATFGKYLRFGKGALNKEERSIMQSKFVPNNGELRTNIAGTDNLGGYAVNETFGNRIIESLKAYNGFLEVGGVFNTDTGATYSMPTVDETAKTGERLGENASANKNNFAMGQFTMGAHKYGSGIMELSEELVQDNGYNLEGKLSEWAATRLGRITNSDMTIGHAGATHIGPVNTGLVQSATASGVTIAANTFTYDKLVDLRTSVDSAYRSTQVSKFCMSSATEALLIKMKDANNNPIWKQDIIGSAPGTLLGYEYFINDFMPEASGSANICMLFGDFSKYAIRFAKGITMKRSTEYAWERGAIAYFAMMRIDAKIEDAGAIKSLAVV